MEEEMEEKNEDRCLEREKYGQGWTRQKAYEEAVKKMKEKGGFTEQQARYLLTLLDQFIPVI